MRNTVRLGDAFCLLLLLLFVAVKLKACPPACRALLLDRWQQDCSLLDLQAILGALHVWHCCMQQTAVQLDTRSRVESEYHPAAAGDEAKSESSKATFTAAFKFLQQHGAINYGLAPRLAAADAGNQGQVIIRIPISCSNWLLLSDHHLAGPPLALSLWPEAAAHLPTLRGAASSRLPSHH